MSVGGNLEVEAGRDAAVAGGDVAITGDSIGRDSYEADWKDSAMSVLGDAEANPMVRSHVERGLDGIEAELEKDEPDTGTIQRLVGDIERIAPIVSTALRAALHFVK